MLGCSLKRGRETGSNHKTSLITVRSSLLRHLRSQKGLRPFNPLQNQTCRPPVKRQYSVFIAGSAAGEYLPPLVVNKGAHLYENWTSGGPDQCKYARTRSGWMEDEVFRDWFKSTFVPFVSDKRKPVILFLMDTGPT